MQAPERYLILSEIASGSTATVFLAEDTLLRRKVALKKLHPHLHNHAEMVKRFAKEAVAIAALSHENIIRVYEYGNQDRNLFLAMEFVDGMTLEGVLKGAIGELPNLAALTLFRQLLEGLAAAHARGVYHRDIKPSNILIDKKGCVRIADFGIAFLSEETSITRTGSYLGTPGYSAPEQADGLPATDRTDIFSTGILFFRCLTGRLPFDGETPHAVLRAIMEKAPPKAASLNPRMLSGMQEMIEAMLVKDPPQRPSALACIDKLESLAHKHGFRSEPPRLARFLTEGEAYREAENREIAETLLGMARQARQRREDREALKSYSLAGIFDPDRKEIRREADALLRSLRTRSRWRILAGAACLALVTAGLIRLALNPEAPAPANAAAAVRPIPLPPTTPASPAAQAGPPAAAAKGPRAGAETKEDSAAQRPAVPGAVASIPAKPAVKAAPPEKKRPGEAKPPTASGHAKAHLPVSKTAPAASTPAVPALPVSPMVAAVSAPSTAPPQPASAAPAPKAAAEKVPGALPLHVGYLRVKTNPPFARLFLDGIEAGLTPTRPVLEITPGPHELILEHVGCRPVHSTFQVAPSETTSIRVVLEKSREETQ